MPELLLASPLLVETSESFHALIDDLRVHRRLAVDTESNSLHAYRERVCLLQFSTSDRDYVLDPLALDDITPLGPIFQDPGIEKIFHAAEYDIICLRRDYGFRFANIFDTMQAGRILGRKLAGLDRLIEDKFDIQVSKRLQKADWGARPLPPELVQYAAQDTHYLIPVRDLLEVELREKGLLELAQEDFRMACDHYQSARPGLTESPSWLRMRARRDLKPKELAILKQLLDWREVTAERLGRPPFKVMNDDRLVSLARSQPTDSDGLLEAGLTERQAQQWGSELLQALARGIASPPVPRTPPVLRNPAYLKRLEELKDWRKKAAAGMEVESDVVLPRGLLLGLAERGAREVQSIMNPSPWRLRRFGEEIAAILQRTPDS